MSSVLVAAKEGSNPQYKLFPETEGRAVPTTTIISSSSCCSGVEMSVKLVEKLGM